LLSHGLDLHAIYKYFYTLKCSFFMNLSSETAINLN